MTCMQSIFPDDMTKREDVIREMIRLTVKVHRGNNRINREDIIRENIKQPADIIGTTIIIIGKNL